MDATKYGTVSRTFYLRGELLVENQKLTVGVTL
ncbi:hypothetical protein CEAn_00517 [Coxiella endosymbiont of Amblyomma nuttalli]|nr:hypothetical protein CEAn_00517 [Coxiella endosymbiont of Amblyomma nuttalli]